MTRSLIRGDPLLDLEVLTQRRPHVFRNHRRLRRLVPDYLPPGVSHSAPWMLKCLPLPRPNFCSAPSIGSPNLSLRRLAPDSEFDLSIQRLSLPSVEEVDVTPRCEPWRLTRPRVHTELARLLPHVGRLTLNFAGLPTPDECDQWLLLPALEQLTLTSTSTSTSTTRAHEHATLAPAAATHKCRRKSS